MEELKVDKQGLCEILGIKPETLKKIVKAKTLEAKLMNKGYKLIKTTKEGRKVFYTLRLENEDMMIYNNILEHTFGGIRKKEEFAKYYKTRTVANDYMGKEVEVEVSGVKFPIDIKVATMEDFAKLFNVSTQTIRKWDNKLIELGIMSKDGYWYFCIDNKKGEIYQCEQEEYNIFWYNTGICEALAILSGRFERGEISREELVVACAGVGNYVGAVEGKFYYRVRKFRTNRDNPNHIYINDLIRRIYPTFLNK